MRIVSVRREPQYAGKAIEYFCQHWATDDSRAVYENCITSCISSKSPLPQWYLLFDDERIIGCAGLITNDFISRMDLYPWICALYIEEDMRGRKLGSQLLQYARSDAAAAGYNKVYLCTDHIGYYEHYGFHYIGDGYHPWGESSRIYEADSEA